MIHSERWHREALLDERVSLLVERARRGDREACQELSVLLRRLDKAPGDLGIHLEEMPWSFVALTPFSETVIQYYEGVKKHQNLGPDRGWLQKETVWWPKESPLHELVRDLRLGFRSSGRVSEDYLESPHFSTQLGIIFEWTDKNRSRTWHYCVLPRGHRLLMQAVEWAKESL